MWNKTPLKFFQNVQAILPDYDKDLLGWSNVIVGCDFRQGCVYREMLLELFKIAENDKSAAHNMESFLGL